MEGTKLRDDRQVKSKDELFELMYVRGYFRIRIPSLSDFDKLLGGLVWGVLNSSFIIDIDLNYQDEET